MLGIPGNPWYRTEETMSEESSNPVLRRLPKSLRQELESDAGCQPALPVIEGGKGFCFQQQRRRHVQNVQGPSQISGCLSGLLTNVIVANYRM